MNVFALWMKVEASTKRTATTTDPRGIQKRGALAVYLTEVYCTPFTPARTEDIARLGLQTPLKLLQTFTANNQDIRTGDYLTVDSKDYAIRAVSPYDGLFSGDIGVIYLIVEEEKV